MKEAIGMQFVLRTATQEDYDALCTLFAQLDRVHYRALPEFFRPVEGPTRSHEFFTEILANDDAGLFVAEHEGSLVGAIHCYIHSAPRVPFIVPRRFVHIEDMVVDESFRHRGVGQALLERVHQWTQEKRLTEVELAVWEFNTPARSLYEKLGYRTTWRRMRKKISLDQS
jgi:ribosomal protein S18 acetylase RimI-like enzyme